MRLEEVMSASKVVTFSFVILILQYLLIPLRP